MNDEEKAICRTILLNPNDDVARLVYADYLEENGQQARAEWIRVSISNQNRISPINKNLLKNAYDEGDERWIPFPKGDRQVTWLGRKLSASVLLANPGPENHNYQHYTVIADFHRGSIKYLKFTSLNTFASYFRDHFIPIPRLIERFIVCNVRLGTSHVEGIPENNLRNLFCYFADPGIVIPTNPEGIIVHETIGKFFWDLPGPVLVHRSQVFGSSRYKFFGWNPKRGVQGPSFHSLVNIAINNMVRRTVWGFEEKDLLPYPMIQNGSMTLLPEMPNPNMSESKDSLFA